MSRIPKRLGEVLVENKILTEPQLLEALNVQRRDRKFLGEIIVELGYLT